MKRVFDPLDIGDYSQYSGCEREILLKKRHKLVSCLGATRLLRFFLRAWIKPGRTYRVLVFAEGCGEPSRLIGSWARKRNIPLQIDALDRTPDMLEISRGLAADSPEVKFIRADSRNFIPESTYDLVCCLNILGSFSEEDGVHVIRRACESSHDKVLLAGLDRNRALMPGVNFLMTALSGMPSGKSEARSLIRRSYSFAEFEELAQCAGLRNYGHVRFLPASQGIWVCKREEQNIPDCQFSVPDFAG